MPFRFLLHGHFILLVHMAWNSTTFGGDLGWQVSELEKEEHVATFIACLGAIIYAF